MATRTASAKAQTSTSNEYRDELLTVKQAARYVNISEPVLRLTIRCGKIPAQGKGKAMRIRKSDLLPFVDPLAALARTNEQHGAIKQSALTQYELESWNDRHDFPHSLPA